ncbi:MAG TPA: hypothetical protein VGJ86_24585 [Acidimicrobiales bacterium]|jgi:hypothetical protein
MLATPLLDAPPVTARRLRPLVGSSVTVRMISSWSMRGTLLSCVTNSVWLVVDDTDIVVPLEQIVSVEAA